MSMTFDSKQLFVTTSNGFINVYVRAFMVETKFAFITMRVCQESMGPEQRTNT